MENKGNKILIHASSTWFAPILVSIITYFIISDRVIKSLSLQVFDILLLDHAMIKTNYSSVNKRLKWISNEGLVPNYYSTFNYEERVL
ncbi:hypothetical protein JOD18_004878 [Gracilibacillus alcaliphilus]|nr:hypothetical protein [Gracilibacillus alcaliphilus]